MSRFRPTRLVMMYHDQRELPAHGDGIPLRATAPEYASHAIPAPGFRDTAVIEATAVICSLHDPDHLAFRLAQTAFASWGRGFCAECRPKRPNLTQAL